MRAMRTNPSMHRRNFLATSSAALAALALPGCGKKSGAKRNLHFFTWAEYIKPEIVARFEQEQECKVVIDTFDANESMYAKLKGGATGYDIVNPSSYMVRTLARDGMLRKLDAAKLPNLKHIDPDYLKSALDPKMEHSVPYMLAPSGLAYLKSKVTEPKHTWRMLERPELKGRITLLNDIREVLGAALKALGLPLNSTDPAQLVQARDLAIQWKKNIAKFENEQYKTGLASGEFWLVHGYAGDIMQVMEENKDIEFFIPEEGAAFSCDDLVVLKDAREPDLAHAFINFLCDPKVAAENMESVSYRSPNTAAYALVSEEFRTNPILFPPAELFAKCEVLDDVGEHLPLWTKMWDEVKAG